MNCPADTARIEKLELKVQEHDVKLAEILNDTHRLMTSNDKILTKIDDMNTAIQDMSREFVRSNSFIKGAAAVIVLLIGAFIAMLSWGFTEILDNKDKTSNLQGQVETLKDLTIEPK